MGAYILRRILIAIPVLFGITILAFGILSTAPDQIGALIDPEARAHMTTQQIEAIRKDLGLDGPPWVRRGPRHDWRGAWRSAGRSSRTSWLPSVSGTQ